MELTWAILVVTLYWTLEIGVCVTPTTKPGACRPACLSNEICNLGVCQQLTNCECAVDPTYGDRCDFQKVTGNDQDDCEAANCCWLTKKRKCFQRNTKPRVKECSRIVPASNRKDYGWPRISPNDCFCVGGCYDDSIKGAIWCFELKIPPPPLPVVTGGACAEEDVCEEAIASCKDGICQCPPTHFIGGPLKDTCTPLIELEKPCTEGDQCKDAHASCDGRKCSCDQGYHNKNGVCVGKIPLDEDCDPNDQCLDVNAFCDGGTCHCNTGFFNKNGKCVPTIELEKPCGTGDKCKDENASCKNGKCRCDANYHNKNGVCVGEIPLGERCDPDDHCADANADCEANYCTCRSTHFPKDGVCVLKVETGKKCDDQDVCKDAQAACTNGVCQCKINYYNRGGVCVGYIDLNKPCGPEDHCADPEASCQQGTCLCKDTHYDKDGVCTEKVDLAGACNAKYKDVCRDENASCKNSECTCNENFHNKNGVCVGTVPLGKVCDPDDRCADAQASCQGGICRCEEGYFEKNGVCTAEIDLGEKCDAGDVCKDDLAICTGGTCQCDSMYHQKGGECVGYIDLNKPAGPGDKCADADAEIIQGFCRCKDTHFEKNGLCVEKIDLMEKCDKNDVCKDDQAACQGGKCDCNVNYHNKNGVCVGEVPLNKKCDQDDKCADGNADCTNGVCKCRATHFNKKGVCTEKIDLGHKCDVGDVCKDAKASCKQGACRCNDNFMIGATGCVAVTTGTCPSSMKFKKEFNACYEHVKAPKDWDDAQAYCESIDPESHLVEIMTLEKQLYVNSVIRGNTLVGGRRLPGGDLKDFEWTYSKVDVDEFQNWLRGQPDRKTVGPQTTPDCLILGGTGKWYDTSCDRKANFLCEYYIDPKEVDLGGKCGPGDKCVTENAGCTGGVCRCRTGYNKVGDQCVDDTFECPSGMTLEKKFNACYKKITDTEDWEGARAKCQDLDPNAHLVEVFTAEKQRYVEEVMAGYNTWLGGHRLTGGSIHDMQWTYSKVMVSAQAYTNWRKGQPDKKSDAPHVNPHCMVGYKTNYLWFDTSCNKKAAFLCERYIGKNLGERCSTGETCVTENSVCSGGVCVCKRGLVEKNGVCQVSTTSASCPSGFTHDHAHGVCYTVVTSGKTWDDARSHCAGLGAHLIEIESQAQQDWLLTVIDTPSIKAFWYGGKRVPKGGLRSFQWYHSKRPFGYTNWKKGQPDMRTLPPRGPADCVIGFPTSGFRWCDRGCGYKASFVCVKDVSPTHPEIIDLNEKCTTNDVCGVANSDCIGGICLCVSGYEEQLGKCVPIVVSLCPRGMSYNKEFDACYIKITQGQSWDDAVITCQNIDPESHLIEVMTKAKQDFVNKFMAGSAMWYGGRRKAGGGLKEFQWTYSDVPVSGYTYWQSRQPDKKSSYEPTTANNPADCMLGYANDKRWCDRGCEIKMPFVCEKYVSASTKNPVDLGEFCSPRDVCITDNSECIHGQCHCIAGYTSRNGECIPQVPLNQLCYKDADCADPEAVCENNLCICPEKFEEENGQCKFVGSHVTVCTETNFDVVMVMDNSGSIDKNEMERQKDFMKGLAGSFELGDDYTRMGLVRFGTGAKIVNHLTSRNSIIEVLRDIESFTNCPNGICPLGGWTNTELGLKAMTKVFNSATNKGNKRIGIIITDGETNRGTLAKGIASIPSDVEMFAVGVDAAKQDELVAMTGSLSKVIQVGNFGKLSAILAQLRETVCGKPDPIVTQCEKSKIDIVFVLDNSGSINSQEMEKQKDFISDVVTSFSIGNQKTRIGLIRYGTRAETLNQLNGDNTQDAVQNDIAQLKPCPNDRCTAGGWTNTQAGLDRMSAMFKDQGTSSRKKVGILMTDGQANRGNLNAGIAGIPSDVLMYAVGVDGAVRSELLAVAKADSRVLQVDDFADLSSAVDDLQTAVCNPVVQCDDSVVDLAFIIDNSGSINYGEMEQQKAFISNLVNSFTISNTKTRIALIKFGTKAVVLNNIKSENTAAAVANDIASLEPCPNDRCSTGGWTNTQSGLDAMTNMFNSANSNRKKIGLLLTDGESNRGNLDAGVARIPSDVKMYAVGVDGAVQSELELVAGDSSRVFQVGNFDALEKIADDVKSAVCGNPGGAVCPNGWTKNGEFNICYIKVTAKKTHAEAEADCKRRNPQSHLVEIKSQDKQQFIKTAMGSTDAWFGAKRSGSGLYNFYWTFSNERISYQHWRGGQPDKLTGDPQGQPDCLIGFGFDGFLWRDRGCGYKAGYLCEMDA